MLTHSVDCPRYVPSHPLCFCVLLSCVLFCVYIVSNRVFVVAVKIFIVEKIMLRRKKTEIVQYCNQCMDRIVSSSNIVL